MSGPENEIIPGDDSGNVNEIINPEGNADVEINGNIISLEVADFSLEEEMDLVDMVDAGKPREGIFDVYYPWDNEAQSQRSTPGFQSPPVVRTCSRCGDANHTLSNCYNEPYTMAIKSCKFCGTVLIGNEVVGMCCGKKKASDKGVCFRRKIEDSDLRAVYSKRVFGHFSMQINKLFAYVHPSAELRYVRGGGPSFLCIQGTDYVRVPQPNAPATYLWSDGPPDISASAHYQFMQKAI